MCIRDSSIKEKIERIKVLRKEFGLNRTLRVLEIPKSTWYYRQRHKLNYGEKYAHIKKDLLQIIGEHPAYGWRKLQEKL